MLVSAHFHDKHKREYTKDLYLKQIPIQYYSLT